MDSELFGNFLLRNGFDSLVGVPCSYFSGLMNFFDEKKLLFLSNNEGESVAMSAGLNFSGKKPVVFFQNSGFGNALNPMTSLILTNKIPSLFLISLRGDPLIVDEPQHVLMGKVTRKLLDDIGIENIVLDQKTNYDYLIKKINKSFYKKKSVALIVRKNQFEKTKDLTKPNKKEKIIQYSKGFSDKNPKLKRIDVLKCIKKKISKKHIIITSTGYTSRELFSLGDEERNFYMVGAMGCCSSIALGMCLGNEQISCVAIDGDGALLMRLGSMSNVGYYQPRNLTHIVLNNNTHESTGGQFTNSGTIDFGKMAIANNYKNVFRCNSIKKISKIMNYCSKNIGPNFIEIPIKNGTIENLERPSKTPEFVAERLNSFIKRNFL